MCDKRVNLRVERRRELSGTDYTHYLNLEDKEYIRIWRGEVWCIRMTGDGIDVVELNKPLQGDDD
ncbi:hypothetical protein [Alicyclobacillus suci]|uniref:hypothetical protein n=1 Tax=Alicyclobacillus suci TaxID=2816080 RepID=UPI001A90AA2F|nr:hypothetical protein [Alicyclobacillus suci]